MNAVRLAELIARGAARYSTTTRQELDEAMRVVVNALAECNCEDDEEIEVNALCDSLWALHSSEETRVIRESMTNEVAERLIRALSNMRVLYNDIEMRRNATGAIEVYESSRHYDYTYGAPECARVLFTL